MLWYYEDSCIVVLFGIKFLFKFFGINHKMCLIFQIFHVIINSNGINYPRCRLECCGGRLRGAVRESLDIAIRASNN